MASNLSKTTQASLAALVEELLERRLSPIQMGLDALLAAAPPAIPPPVTVPAPAPAPSVSGCIVTVTSADGTPWRWNATADAKQDTLGLRAMIEVPPEIVGCSSLRLVVDLGPGWAIVVPRNDITNRPGGGTARYSIQVHLDGKLVLDDRDIEHRQYRGTRPYPLGRLPAWPLPSTDSLIGQGLVARYAQGPVDEARLAAWGAAVAAPEWQERWGARGITQYMPGTGGRDDIGPATAPQTAYLISRDPRAMVYAFGQAQAGATIPWAMWDAEASTWVTPRRWPRLWTDGRGSPPGKGTLLQSIDDADWTPEIAHQPDLFYVPYLLTGERWLLDNLQAQAAWSVLVQWPDMRGPTDDNVVWGNQVRGAAWGLRQIDNAAWASPKGSAEREYFEAASAHNWRWVRAQIPLWTEQQGEAAGWIVGSYGTAGALPPWQQDYFASTALSAARRGNADALEVLRWMRGWLVGRFERLGHDGCAYLLAAYDPDTGRDYRTWAEVQAATVARGWSNGDGWDHSQGDFAQLARFTLLGLADVLDDAEARRLADWLVTEGAPFTGPEDYMRDPMLRVEAGG